MPAQKSPRYLVVRLRRLGDIVVSEPVVRALRNSAPGTEVDIVVEPAFEDIVRHNPDLDRTLLFDRGWDRLPIAKRASRYRNFFRILRQKEYTAVIDLHSNPRSILISYLARTKTRIGRKKIHNLFFSYRLAAVPGPVQTARQLLHLLSPLGLDNENAEPTLFVPQEAKDRVRTRYALEEKGFVVICPGSNKPYWTRWAPENFSRAARELADGGNRRVLVITGPKEAELAAFFRKNCAGSDGIRVVENELSTIELAAAISMAALFIGNNSGPLHICGALGTPAVAIYGPSMPDTWAVPDKTPHRHMFKRVGCNPCNESRCPFTPRKCLAAVGAEEVVAAAEELLA